MRRLAAAIAAAGLLTSACMTVGGGDGTPDGGPDLANPGDCAAVDVAVSPEKLELLGELANRFNEKDKGRDDCAFVRIQRRSSGSGADLLSRGWPEDEAGAPQPVIWSPAARSWGAVVNQRLADRGGEPIAPADAKSFMLTPLVIAMPKPMADALGYPEQPVGYADLIKLAQDPAGWGSKGHPEWGAFKLGKTNPNFSTSALSATIAQYYAATGKTAGLSSEDLDRPEVTQFARSVESSVVHYGDITMTFLNNWFRNDARGTALTYVSAVAVEEKSLIDYNAGNPDGITDPGEKPRKPRIPLVAIYPKEGTLFSDNPLFVLDAPWVSARERAGAQRFSSFVQEPGNQRKVLEFGFRPGNPRVAVSEPIVKANGVDPNQPQTTLEVPSPSVLVRLIDKWAEDRKGARVLLVLDVSGSMGEDAGNGQTKMDVAKEAAIDALQQFKGDDLVGLRIFTTNIAKQEPRDYLDLVPIGPITQTRELMASKIRTLTPLEGTPLYTTTKASYDHVRQSYDPARINAVVLLTDGKNEDERNNDIDGLLNALRSGAEGLSSTPVRVFTIAFGAQSDLGSLKRIAEATNAAAYDAKDPQTIHNVFTAVVSNF